MTVMKNKILIIDGNNLLHRAYHQFRNMRSPGGKLSSMAFGFPFILQSLIRTHKPESVLVLFDGGKDKYRLKVLPNYKNREKRDDFDIENFLSQKESVEKILKALGIAYTYNKGVEADDLIWLWARRFKRKKQNVVIVSTDKDFHQLLSSRVSIWNPWKSKRITHKNLKHEVGYEPWQCVDYLSLDGDASDKIPGYPGIGPKRAVSFLEKFGSIDNFLSDRSNKFGKVDHAQLRALYKVNKVLIDIKYFCRLTNKTLKKYTLKQSSGRVDKKELVILCSEYGIRKFLEKPFIETFKNLKPIDYE